ncbi:ribose-5-phosphate isomerase RpiA, partial [Aquiflexum sp.]|uniref:ribose-5-phosphate isomerase RpiA n=1 Tax=Aquiflexum sp. TaxID=1872584 RepID=UPI003594003B
THMDKKQIAGEAAVQYIEDGMIIGLGSGSTVYWTIKRIGELVSEGMRISGIPSSMRTEKLAKEFSIPLVSFNDVRNIDITIDGADEVDPNLNLIKGGGGSVLREKILAFASKALIIVVDEEKLVKRLGNFPLPVEVTPFGIENTLKKITELGCEAKLRLKDNQIFLTDNNNFIADCNFQKIKCPSKLSIELNQIPGVIENGLFYDIVNKVIIGSENNCVRTLKRYGQELS